jgi:hypothetical protein
MKKEWNIPSLFSYLKEESDLSNCDILAKWLETKSKEMCSDYRAVLGNETNVLVL